MKIVVTDVYHKIKYEAKKLKAYECRDDQIDGEGKEGKGASED